MADEPYDVVVIGAGPGGYVAAIRAAQLGMKTALVEKRETLGGTCLNVGCIPSKALLQSSHLFAEAQHKHADHGIKTGNVQLDLATMMKRKDAVVGDTVKGVAFLMKKNKVTVVTGTGAVTAPDEVTVSPGKGKKKQVLKAENIVIATGSDVAPLPGVEIDEKKIVSSTGALAFEKVPKTMIVIGAGVIGLEMGSVWKRLGSEVTVIEYLDGVFPGMDKEISKQAQRIFERQGLNFKLSTKVTGAKAGKDGVSLTMEPVAGGGEGGKKNETLKAEIVLVAIGRRPYTEGLGLDKLGVEVSERGFVKVDKDYQTNVPGIFAIGDAIGGPMLAHKAEDEGVVVAELIAGQSGHIEYDAVPAVVYTWPEVAYIGKTEEQLKEAGVEYKAGKFPFSANARARANNDTDGFVKVLADAKTDRILGVHIIGPEAGDLIQEAVVAMEFGGSAEDLARASHGHPGLAEAVKEAALAAYDKPLHI